MGEPPDPHPGVSIEERYRGRNGSDSNRTLTYIVRGTDSDSAAIEKTQWYTPGTWDGLLGESINVTQLADDIWVTAAEYTEPESQQRDPPATNSAEYSFNFRAAGEHIYQSINSGGHLGIWKRTGFTGEPFDFNGSINVVWDGGHFRVEGQNLAVPPTTNTWTFYPELATVDDDYQQDVEKLMGTVNDAEFYGRPAGTMRFVGCQGSIRNADSWQISFEFAYKPNLTGITIPGIETTNQASGDIDKDGHELLWILYRDEHIESKTLRVARPFMVYVDQVVAKGDFSKLQLPGSVPPP